MPTMAGKRYTRAAWCWSASMDWPCRCRASTTRSACCKVSAATRIIAASLRCAHWRPRPLHCLLFHPIDGRPAATSDTHANHAMTPIPFAISARHKGFNRAEIVDQNFIEFVQLWAGQARAAPRDDQPVLPGSALDAGGFRELFESQLISRHLDLMARVLRVQNKVFYTIGSSGHEGNAMVARLTRHTDPAFLHYRSGGFMAERFRKLPGMDPVMDSALS